MIEPFIASIIVSSISLVAIIFLSLMKNKYWRIINFGLISLAAGTFLGDAFLHLLPEAINSGKELAVEDILVWTLIGILFFFILEQLIHWHQHSNDNHSEHKHDYTHLNLPLILNNLIGDGLHNLLDGVAIAASFAISIPTGVATTLAIILHELPQELADFGILTHAGLNKIRALTLNLFSALLAIVGVILFFIFGESLNNGESYILAFLAGMFIYIATADLIPEIHKGHFKLSNVIQVGLVLIGCLVMVLLRAVG